MLRLQRGCRRKNSRRSQTFDYRNRNSRAMRMYWVYGPQRQDITVIGLEPYPEDKKRGAYDKVVLSDV